MDIFLGEPPANIKQFIIETYGQHADPDTHFTVQMTSSYKKAGIYSAQRDDTTKPVVIDWGDGTVEQVNGDVSQKVHEYASVGTFNATISNVKAFAASANNYTWYYTTSQNYYTLKEVVLGSSVTSIGSYAFSGCSGLTSVTIPDSVTSIGSNAFRGCSGLTSVTIPDSVTSIGDQAFGSCDNLTIITIGNVLNDFTNRFNPTTPITEIHFPNNTVAEIQAAYPNPQNWFGLDTRTITIVGSNGSYMITVSCFLKGTDILLADGTTKKIENLTYNDVLKVWDFDEGELGSAKVCWLTRPGLKSNHYYQLTFDDGTVLKTTGINSNHRIFSVDQNKFTNICDAKAGDKVYSINGVLTITDVQYVEEECEYYNVMTAGKINCFANGILTSDRYGNLYPIVDMKYVKDGRAVRPYSEYEAVGIDKYWYDNLRLGENTETVEKSKEYVWKCFGQMLPLPTS